MKTKKIETTTTANFRIKLVKKRLPVSSIHIGYDVYRYKESWCEDDEYASAHVEFFDREKFDDIELITPLPKIGKFNITYPFSESNPAIFEIEFPFSEVKTVGDLLKIVSEAYSRAYDLAHKYGLGYFHGIEDLVFEIEIRIYDNGTVQYEIGS